MSLRWALMLAAVLAVAGCGRPDQQAAPARPPSLSEQARRVRQGRGHEIRIESPLGGEELTRLGRLPLLKKLEIEDSRLTDRAAASFQQFPNLEHLVIRGQPLGDPLASELARLKSLRVLNLPDTEFTDAALAELARLPRLELLRISSPKLTDRAMGHIARMPSLRFLHLIDVPITDRGLTPLRDMKQLESFYLDGGRASDDALGELVLARPDLHVHIDQGHHDRDPQKGHDTPAVGN